MRFEVERTWACNFSVRKIAISWALQNRIWLKMTRLTDTNEENVWNFWQNFLSTSLSRNEIWSWKNVIRTMVIWPDFSTHGIGRWLIQQVLFRENVKFFSGILTPFFDLSLKAGYFPKQFKEAIIIPIYKQGEKECSWNYWPISLLTTFAKISRSKILTALPAHIHLSPFYRKCTW